MKVAITSAALMAGIAQAGFADMRRDFGQMTNRYVRGLIESGTVVFLKFSKTLKIVETSDFSKTDPGDFRLILP